MKYCVITGGAGLLGKQHCIAVAKAGISPIIFDIQNVDDEFLDDISSKYGVNPQFIKLDITIENQVVAAKGELSNISKDIGYIINNAAIDPKVQDDQRCLTRLENYSVDQWSKELAVGLDGMFLTCKHFGPLLARNDEMGVILNVASDLAIISPDQRLYEVDGLDLHSQPVKPVSYSVIKHGVIGFTKYLATYWPGKVRCNALCPGGVYNGQNSDFVARLESRIPLGRMAKVDEYQKAVQFLLCEGSDYMNGQALIMDGGRSVW